VSRSAERPQANSGMRSNDDGHAHISRPRTTRRRLGAGRGVQRNQPIPRGQTRQDRSIRLQKAVERGAKVLRVQDRKEHDKKKPRRRAIDSSQSQAHHMSHAIRGARKTYRAKYKKNKNKSQPRLDTGSREGVSADERD
jgi:hypothetical protein